MQLFTVPKVALIIAGVISVRQTVAAFPLSIARASLVIAVMSAFAPEDGGAAVGLALGEGAAAVGAALLFAALSLPPLLPQPAVVTNAAARIVGPRTRMRSEWQARGAAPSISAALSGRDPVTVPRFSPPGPAPMLTVVVMIVFDRRPELSCA
jgi:hypothetical protein